MNIVDEVLRAIEEVKCNNLEIEIFKSTFKAQLLLTENIEDGFYEEQEKLENLLQENIGVAKRFFNILKTHFLEKIYIYKTGNDQDFKMFTSIRSFESRFLNIDRESLVS